MRTNGADETGRHFTSADVAALAGVSRSSVSLVLNGRAAGHVSEQNQVRVLEAAEKLGYLANAPAVNLRRQRSGTIGLVSDRIATSPYAGPLIQGARDAALARGYMLLTADTGDDPAREDEAVHLLRSWRVDAFIVAAQSLRLARIPPETRTRPTVLANCFADDNSAAGVIPDNVGGGRVAARSVLDAGHTKVVLLGGAKEGDSPTPPAVEQRRTGFIQAHREVLGEGSWNQTVGGYPRIQEVGWDIDDGYRAAMLVLTADDRPTAIVCATDRLAIGVVLAATRLGLDIPQDLSVVGFDDQEHLAGRMVPALTTVSLPHAKIGGLAASLVLGACESGNDIGLHEQHLVPCELVPRDSVAPPPGAKKRIH